MTTYLLFGFLVESLVEYIFSEWAGKYAKYISLAIGVALSVAYHLDLIAALTGHSVPYVGCVFTGLVIGRGANYVNDIVDFLRSFTQRAG